MDNLKKRSPFHPLIEGLPATYWYLWVGILINRVGFFVLPFLAIYLTSERGFSVAAAGLAVALYGVGGIVATLVGGTLADRIGRRRTLLFSLFVGPLVMLSFPFAHSPAMIFVLTLLTGAIYELYRPAANAAIADVVPLGHRRRAFALYYWVLNLGFAIGATLAGIVATKGYVWLFVCDAATTFSYGVVVYLRVPETRPTRREQSSWLNHVATPFKDGVFATFVLITFGLACIFSLFSSMLPIEMSRDGLSPAQYGRLIAINGVLIVCLQPAVAKLAARFSSAHVMAAAAMLIGIGFGTTGFVDSTLGYAGTIALWTLGEMAWLPVGPTIVATLAPSSVRGAYQGAYGMGWAAASSIGPSLGGLVMNHFGSKTLWTSCVLIGALSSIGFLLLGPAMERTTAARLTPPFGRLVEQAQPEK
jgi:MFS family permease